MHYLPTSLPPSLIGLLYSRNIVATCLTCIMSDVSLCSYTQLMLNCSLPSQNSVYIYCSLSVSLIWVQAASTTWIFLCSLKSIFLEYYEGTQNILALAILRFLMSVFILICLFLLLNIKNSTLGLERLLSGWCAYYSC